MSSLSDLCLSRELFGPILAVVPIDSVDVAIGWINSQ